MKKITPFLWFDNQAEEAANFYVSVFPNSKILDKNPMAVTFDLDGQQLVAFNGGPSFKFTEAISLSVDCNDQEEVDRLWDVLSNGGSPSQCGWLKDKYGLSWQIVPKQLRILLSDPDRKKADRVMQAMLKMKKIIISDLQKAYDNNNG